MLFDSPRRKIVSKFVNRVKRCSECNQRLYHCVCKVNSDQDTIPGDEKCKATPKELKLDLFEKRDYDEFNNERIVYVKDKYNKTGLNERFYKQISTNKAKIPKKLWTTNSQTSKVSPTPRASEKKNREINPRESSKPLRKKYIQELTVNNVRKSIYRRQSSSSVKGNKRGCKTKYSQPQSSHSDARDTVIYDKQQDEEHIEEELLQSYATKLFRGDNSQDDLLSMQYRNDLEYKLDIGKESDTSEDLYQNNISICEASYIKPIQRTSSFDECFLVSSCFGNKYLDQQQLNERIQYDESIQKVNCWLQNKKHTSKRKQNIYKQNEKCSDNNAVM